MPVSYTHLDVYKRQIEQRPDTIDNMKPVLYGIIRKVLQ